MPSGSPTTTGPRWRSDQRRRHRGRSARRIRGVEPEVDRHTPDDLYCRPIEGSSPLLRLLFGEAGGSNVDSGALDVEEDVQWLDVEQNIWTARRNWPAGGCSTPHSAAPTWLRDRSHAESTRSRHKWQQQERRAGARVVIVHGVQTPLDTRGEGHLPAPQAPTPRSQISFSPGSGGRSKKPRLTVEKYVSSVVANIYR